VNKVKKILIFTNLLSLCIACGEAVEFSLKFAGGLSVIRPAEATQVLQDWEQWQIRNADYIKSWSYLTGTVSEIKTAWDLEVEFLFSLTSRFAVGLASGYIYGSVTEKDTSLTIERALGVFDVGKPTKMTAIPLILSVYYIQPITQSLRTYVRGGGGFLWATYVERESIRRAEAEKYGYPTFIQTSARDTMVLLALGILFETEPGISFFVEGTWRQAKVSGFDGENETGTMGTLFFVEEYSSQLDYWQRKHMISQEAPSGENYRSAKAAEVNFGGLSVKAGIMIRF
jgi:hypothetical protein